MEITSAQQAIKCFFFSGLKKKKEKKKISVAMNEHLGAEQRTSRTLGTMIAKGICFLAMPLSTLEDDRTDLSPPVNFYITNDTRQSSRLASMGVDGFSDKHATPTPTVTHPLPLSTVYTIIDTPVANFANSSVQHT